jgi:hypothetical protein
MTDVSPDTIIKLRLWVTLLAGLLALTFIGHTDNFWLQLLSRGLEAVCIAMVIAIFVDVFLKRDLMRDVFLASIGYVLPKELQPEMRWLCQLNALCTQDVMICTLTPIGDSVKFHFQRKQVVKNIGQNRLDLKVGLGIDQWFRGSDGESHILKFSFVSEEQQWFHTGEAKKSDFGLNLPDDPVVSLEKDKEVTITSEFEEVYPRNGYFFMHIKYATSGLRITVNCPSDSGLGIYVNFASREGHKTLQVEQDYVCPFTLLPYQRVAVRFWDKGQSATWLNSN